MKTASETIGLLQDLGDTGYTGELGSGHGERLTIKDLC